MSKIKLILPDSPVTGQQISFIAPCNSDTTTCFTINDVDYIICDAAGNNLAGVAGMWVTNAFVSVIVDVDSAKAYIQNANTNKYIEEKFDAVPAKVSDDGYTDISGLRRSIHGNVVKDGNTITITTTLQGNITSTTVLTLDDNGEYPISIVTDGVEADWKWSGFDE